MDKNLKKKFSSPAYLAAAAAATTVNTTAPLHSPRPRRSVPCDRSSSPYLLLGIIRFSSLGCKTKPQHKDAAALTQRCGGDR